MPIRSSQPGQCIFCAFRLQSRRAPPRLRHQPRGAAGQHGSFSTASGSQRSEVPIRRTYGRGPAVRGRDWERSKGLVVRKVDSHRDPKGPEVLAYDVFRKNRFKRIVLDRLEAIEPKLKSSPIFQQPGMTDAQIDKTLGQFRWHVRESISNDMPNGTSGAAHELQTKLFDAMKDRGQPGLDSELQYALYNHFLGKNFSPEDIQNQKALADLRYPTEWFPEPRAMHRTIHAHVGPTNSGKTYHALQRLEKATSGLYAGPLRLLAHEVYSKLNAKGKLCALVTGEEQRLPDGWQDSTSKIVSATVEMTNLESEYDVAVIDEIQMLASLERGFAWTQALLGLRAKEIHVCGEVRALPMIRELAAAAGDKLVVHEYDRLTTLRMDKDSLRGSFKDLRKGDCIVTFSVVNIHALRTEVERKTGRKAAVVYGSLPPETRAQQARLFNDPTNDYDYLIASDAVGMGLNLSIKRIIFETVHKFNNGALTTLTVSEIRQIAGRAGRYRGSQGAIAAAGDGNDASKVADDGSAAKLFETRSRLDDEKPRSGPVSIESELEAGLEPGSSLDAQLSTRAEFDHATVGLVTTIDNADFETVRKALKTEPPPLTFATIQPPAGIVQRFASYFPPATPFSYILLRLSELSATSHRYKIYHKRDMIMLADLIHGIEGLSTEDRMIFINAPSSLRDRDSGSAKLLKELALCIGRQGGGELLTLKNINLDLLDEPTQGTRLRLKSLEELHKGLVMYLWLSFRFPGVFTQRPLGNYAKELVEDEIDQTLRLMTFSLSNAEHRERLRKRSRVEDDIMRAVREEQALRNKTEVAEPGFESPGAEDIAGEESDEPQMATERGEQMPEDDQGEYTDEEASATEGKMSSLVAEKQAGETGNLRDLLGRMQSAEDSQKDATQPTEAPPTDEAGKQSSHG